MTPELEVLKTVAARLESAGLSYMVTGSMAHNLYATPRMTRDIDLVVELAPDQADAVYNLFSPDFYADRNVIREEIRRRGMFNVIHYASVVKVDFIIRKSGAYRDEEFRRRRRVTIDDVPLFVVAPEDLVISKLFWARESRSEMQLGDMRNLMDSVEELDKGYMDHWVEQMRRGVAMDRGAPTQRPSGRSRLRPRLRLRSRRGHPVPRRYFQISGGPLQGGVGVRDTSPEMEQRFRRMLMSRSGEERLKMGCSMHETARTLVIASVLAERPDASPEEIRRALFLRFYGQEFDAEAREKILRHLLGREDDTRV